MRINPLLILIYNALLPLIMMAGAMSTQFHIFYMFFSSLCLILAGRIKRLAKFLLIYLVFFLIYNLFGFTKFELLNMVARTFRIYLELFPCFIMASILVLDYSILEIIAALDRFALSKTLIVLLAIIIRYLPTIKREFLYIRESMRLRGISFSLKRPLQSMEYFFVPQLFRSEALANEITAAALIKGISAPGKRTYYNDVKLGLFDIILVTFFIGGFIILCLY